MYAIIFTLLLPIILILTPNYLALIQPKQSKKVNLQSHYSIQYLDLYDFYYFINNKNLFILKLCLKYFNFIIIKGQVLKAKSIKIVVILITNRFSIELCDIAYTSNCDVNLISLTNQICDSNIKYIDNIKVMIFISL